jgi:hypothetical protein
MAVSAMSRTFRMPNEFVENGAVGNVPIRHQRRTHLRGHGEMSNPRYTSAFPEGRLDPVPQ